MGAADREEVPVQLDLARLLLVPAGDGDDHAIGPVSDRPTALVQAVPPLDLIVPGLHRRQLDAPHLLAPAGDPDRHIGGRGSTDPEFDPHAIDRIDEASGRRDGRAPDDGIVS
jgi:hypothetical protein